MKCDGLARRLFDNFDPEGGDKGVEVVYHAAHITKGFYSGNIWRKF